MPFFEQRQIVKLWKIVVTFNFRNYLKQFTIVLNKNKKCISLTFQNRNDGFTQRSWFDVCLSKFKYLYWKREAAEI